MRRTSIVRLRCASARLAKARSATAALVLAASVCATWTLSAQMRDGHSAIGQGVSVARHLRDGDELALTPMQLIEAGRRLFTANWTIAEGGGRPMNTGLGRTLADPAHPLAGSRAFNRVSGPDANSCQGCHNRPGGVAGGAGDFVANAFEAAQRFDFVTFDRRDARATGGSVDEAAREVSLATVGNARSTPSL